jgi:hypothetical protein
LQQHQNLLALHVNPLSRSSQLPSIKSLSYRQVGDFPTPHSTPTPNEGSGQETQLKQPTKYRRNNPALKYHLVEQAPSARAPASQGSKARGQSLNPTQSKAQSRPGCPQGRLSCFGRAPSGDGRISARIAEILAAGAERAEITVEHVLRELAVLGFSDIGKVVRWRPELVYEELEDAESYLNMDVCPATGQVILAGSS